jgi:hypothetical protein
MDKINANSVVDSLMENLTLDAGSQVEVDEKSLLAEISEERDRSSKEEFKWEGFNWEIDKNARLPLLRALCSFIWSCIMGLIYLFYYMFEKVLWMFSRKKFDLKTSVKFNIVICSGVLVAFATVLLYMMVFLIKDVVLFPMASESNSQGTLCLSQPCCIDHYIRLLGTDECWEDTGIRIAEGDKVEIVYSGAFYGNIDDYVEAAKHNRKLKYAISDRSEEAGEFEFGMYKTIGKDSAKFGALLYQIKSETEEPAYRNETSPGSRQEIYQISINERQASFIADRPGVLSFAVNDIYVYNQKLLDAARKGGHLDYNTKDEIKIRRRDSTLLANPTLLFADNIGEYLLHVTITRNSFEDDRPLFNQMIRSYRWLFIEKNWRWLIMAFIGLLLIDILFGVYLRSPRRK